MTNKELSKFSRCNHEKACIYYWPELNGVAPDGYVLHHKNPLWKIEDPIRYAEWRPEDLEPMTRAEHASLHRKLLWSDASFKENQIKTLKEALLRSDVKEKKIEAAKNTWSDPSIRQKRVDGLKEANLRSDVKQKHSAIMKKRYEDPKERELQSIRSKLSHSNPEVKAKMSVALKNMHWWNNGLENKRAIECPGEDWKKRQNYEREAKLNGFPKYA